jgi:hypothetical protein
VEKYDTARHATVGNTAHALFMIDTGTHYEYIIFIAFPPQKLSHVRASMLRLYAHVNYYNRYALAKKLKNEIVLVLKLLIIREFSQTRNNSTVILTLLPEIRTKLYG